MKIVLVILVALMPSAALAAEQKSNQAPKKATSSARQTRSDGFGSRPAQGAGNVGGAGKVVGGH